MHCSFKQLGLRARMLYIWTNKYGEPSNLQASVSTCQAAGTCDSTTISAKSASFLRFLDLEMSEVQVGIVMGSDSDWDVMQHACKALDGLDIAYEKRIVSAHRTPDLLFEYAESAASRGLKAIIAGAGGAAHLPGMLAAKTTVPVLGVPVNSRHLKGMDSLLSIVQMPAGVPVATFAIGKAGATNAGLFAASILATSSPETGIKLEEFRTRQTQDVLSRTLPDS